MVLPGSITQRRTRCGRPSCGCHADPPRLHGPYWQWTRKIAAKTVCRWLSADQHHDYQSWIDNDRRLRELLARLEALGAAAFEADPRWARQARYPASKTGTEPPDSVGSTRLTCGWPFTWPSYAQLRAKREVLPIQSHNSNHHNVPVGTNGLPHWKISTVLGGDRDSRRTASAWHPCGCR